MENNNGTKHLKKEYKGKNGFNQYKIPIFEIPKNEDRFIFFMFKEDIQSIQSCFMNQNSIIIKQYQIDNYPIEKCKICQCELSIDNLSFFENNENVDLFCHKCCPDEGINIDLSILKKESSNNNQIIDKLKSFLENDKGMSTLQHKKIFDSLIFYTNIIIIMIDLLKEYNAFQQSIIYFQNYIKSLSSYIEILKEFNIENIYIFLKNLVVVSSNKIDVKFAKGFFKHYFLNYNNFNSSEIQLRILQTSFENSDTSMLVEIASLKIEKIKNGLDKDINRLNKDFSSIKDDINVKNNSWLKKKMRIMELKGNITNILQSYYNSHNNLFSKKVLESKFINEIIYLLFKYNYNRFQRIKEDDNIINSIQKEFQNIIRFLGNSNNNTKIKLIEKIKNEIQYFESKKELNNKKSHFSKYVPKPKKGDKYKVYSKGKVSLTIEEKALLNEYLSSSTEDSYTSIYASKFNNTDGINYAKIQVILEFLFFIRDKTICTIHLLSESSSLFFEFLNKFISNKDLDPDQNEIFEFNNKENEIHDFISDGDIIEELKNNYMYNSSEEPKVKNEEILSKLTVKSSVTINYISALNYIFRNKHKNDNINEIKYLYENISLPENKINNILKENDKATNIN